MSIYTMELEWYYLFIGLTEEDKMNSLDYVFQAICVGLPIATFLLITGRAVKAIEVYKECLIFLNDEVLRKKGEKFVNLVGITIYRMLFMAYCLIPDYTNAIKHGNQLLDIYHERGKTGEDEGILMIRLAMIYEKLFKYVEAEKLYEKAISITTEIGDRKGEATAYGNLGVMFLSLGGYDKAKEYLWKALAITIEIRDRAGEGNWYGNLGTVCLSLGEYGKAKEYVEKALAIKIEIGDKKGEARDYGNLGNVFLSRGEYDKAKEYFEKALAIAIEICDRAQEARCYRYLGNLSLSHGEYGKAKEFVEKALAIRIEIGDKTGKATDYGNLGTVFLAHGEYGKAKEYLEKALAIRIEIGDKKREATDYGNLGVNFQALGEHDKAIEYLERALAITKEIGDRELGATCYRNLGTVFQHAGECDRAKEYYEKALAIRSEIGGKRGEAADYVNLGNVFKSLGEYEEAKDTLDKALAITVEIDDRAGQGNCYGILGTLFQSLGEYDKAEQYFQKGLVIRKEIGDRAGEAAVYLSLGRLMCNSIGEPVIAEGYLEKALSISQLIGDLDKEFDCLCDLTVVKLTQNKIQEAVHYAALSVVKSERLRAFLRDNDQFKISFSDALSIPCRNLAAFLVSSGNDPSRALYVLELARARGLADLMATRYSAERKIPAADPQSWIGIENIMKQESSCSCLYIYNHLEKMFFWILKVSGTIHFRTLTLHESDIAAGFSGSSNEFFAASFRSFGMLPQEDCEDRSLNDIESKQDFSQEEELASLRRSSDRDDTNLSLTLLYNMIIAPVADLLEEPEIIIVPDSCLYHVPFPALLDDSGKYLSEAFSIRIVPSLTTLRSIQDSPADYHSQCGVLIVGDPEVGLVRFNGRRKTFKPLPFARREAEMIGRLLGVQPLLGKEANKQAVLEKLHSAGLIHFAAHGDAERGEIVLSPVRSTGKIPKEQDYLLTMSDVLEVELRAKLVVLSCCHSGRGKIRAEGVVGISRAFLGSGARSVLVALWALDDEATEQFMSRFYEHLVRGESTSECLHQAMEWMRGNGWPEVKQWAPFMLIGDNVTFEFGK